MEMCVFYSQIFAMIVFLLLSQIMATIKRANNSDEEINTLIKEDPYWKALLDDGADSKVDFLAVESYSMSSLVLILNNISVLVFAMETIFPETISKYWFVVVAFLSINAITLVYFLFMVYKGTAFSKMFNMTN